MYITQRMTVQEIADHFLVSRTQARNWLIREKIDFRAATRRKNWVYPDKSPKATHSPTSQDIAWAAGFIEGEGTFINRRFKGSKKRSSFIAAYQVNREPLIRLKNIFGGIVYRNPRPSIQTISVWKASGRRARGVSMTIYSLLSKKRQKQARKIWL